MSKSATKRKEEKKQRKKQTPQKATNETSNKKSSNLSWRKRTVFALIPVTVLLIATESALWLTGWDSRTADPYDSFVLKKPLFIEQDGVLITDDSRTSYFHLQKFERAKPKQTKRVFVFGGSTTHGAELPDPWRDSYVFQLGKQLGEEFPDQEFEMINCGGRSYASYRLVNIVEECMEYAPDLVIVMMGHNEFLEARHYAGLKKDPSNFERILYSSRTFRLVQHTVEKYFRHLGENPFITEKYIVRDKKEFEHTLIHYKKNLNRMVDACREKDIPIILSTCPSNLRDNRPFVSLVNTANITCSLQTYDPLYRKPTYGFYENSKLTTQDRQEFYRLLQQIQRADQLQSDGKFKEALTVIQSIQTDNPESAICYFLAGKCYDGLGEIERAKKLYILAKDADAFPHRNLDSFNEAVREIAIKRKAELFDAEAVFYEKSPIPGSDLFYDDCHPRPQGHMYFADGLKEIVVRLLRGDTD